MKTDKGIAKVLAAQMPERIGQLFTNMAFKFEKTKKKIVHGIRVGLSRNISNKPRNVILSK